MERMNAALRGVALGLSCLLLVLAHPAQAQVREFNGTVVSASGSTLAVQSRRGETLTFTKGPSTRVEGKSGWGALAAGDRVLVRWQLQGGPRVVQSVVVLPSRN
ncbi:MAG: hypothetical protein AAF430_17250 [Myxococcota bacterium]